jgi:hypothetical protein
MAPPDLSNAPVSGSLKVAVPMAVGDLMLIVQPKISPAATTIMKGLNTATHNAAPHIQARGVSILVVIISDNSGTSEQAHHSRMFVGDLLH